MRRAHCLSTELGQRRGTRDSSGWARGAGAEPAEPLRPRDCAEGAPIPSGAWGRTESGRVHSQEGAAVKARGGIGCKPVSPRSGAPKARLAAKEETCQAAEALLAAVNAPGPTRSELAAKHPRSCVRAESRTATRSLYR